MSKKCIKCDNNVGLFAHLFGLRICKECDIKPIKDLFRAQEKQIKRMMEENFKKYIKLISDYIKLDMDIPEDTIKGLIRVSEDILK